MLSVRVWTGRNRCRAERADVYVILAALGEALTMRSGAVRVQPSGEGKGWRGKNERLRAQQRCCAGAGASSYKEQL